MSFHVVKTRIGWVLPQKAPSTGEGLVIPANDHLWMTAGPGLELKKRLGKEVELDAVRFGPVAPGVVVVTTPPGTGFTHLFHAVVSGQDLHWLPGAGAQAVENLLAEATRRKVATLLVHPFHRGVHGDRIHAAKETLGAFLRVLEAGSSVREITVLVENDEEWKLYQDLFLQLLKAA